MKSNMFAQYDELFDILLAYMTPSQIELWMFTPNLRLGSKLPAESIVKTPSKVLEVAREDLFAGIQKQLDNGTA